VEFIVISSGRRKCSYWLRGKGSSARSCQISVITKQVDDLIHLESPANGMGLTILQAAKSVKLGQAGVKLVFQVEDIEAFKTKSAKAGLKFGATHEGPGYAFANAKDPSGNAVQISSRRFVKPN
jgi:predicted enzyme related to lactoylglutathione lyase